MTLEVNVSVKYGLFCINLSAPANFIFFASSKASRVVASEWLSCLMQAVNFAINDSSEIDSLDNSLWLKNTFSLDSSSCNKSTATKSLSANFTRLTRYGETKR